MRLSASEQAAKHATCRAALGAALRCAGLGMCTAPRDDGKAPSEDDCQSYQSSDEDNGNPSSRRPEGADQAAAAPLSAGSAVLLGSKPARRDGWRGGAAVPAAAPAGRSGERDMEAGQEGRGAGGDAASGADKEHTPGRRGWRRSCCGRWLCDRLQMWLRLQRLKLKVCGQGVSGGRECMAGARRLPGFDALSQHQPVQLSALA